MSSSLEGAGAASALGDGDVRTALEGVVLAAEAGVVAEAGRCLGGATLGADCESCEDWTCDVVVEGTTEPLVAASNNAVFTTASAGNTCA
jgi:hypothetical protein